MNHLLSKLLKKTTYEKLHDLFSSYKEGNPTRGKKILTRGVFYELLQYAKTFDGTDHFNAERLAEIQTKALENPFSELALNKEEILYLLDKPEKLPHFVRYSQGPSYDVADLFLSRLGWSIRYERATGIRYLESPHKQMTMTLLDDFNGKDLLDASDRADLSVTRGAANLLRKGEGNFIDPRATGDRTIEVTRKKGIETAVKRSSFYTDIRDLAQDIGWHLDIAQSHNGWIVYTSPNSQDLAQLRLKSNYKPGASLHKYTQSELSQIENILINNSGLFIEQ